LLQNVKNKNRAILTATNSEIGLGGIKKFVGA